MQLCLMWGTLLTAVITALCILHSLWKIPGRHKEKLPPNKEAENTVTSTSQLQTIKSLQPSNKLVHLNPCDTSV